MKLTITIAALIAAVLAVGCAAGPEAWRVERTAPQVQGPVSVLDLRWVQEGLGGAVAMPRAEELAPADRFTAPQAYVEAQRGRVTPEAVPKLPPLPESEVWRPETSKGQKPELTYDPDILQAQVKPPVPGVREILEARGGEAE